MWMIYNECFTKKYKKMKKKEFFTPEVKEVMDFMFRINEKRTFVFVNDFQGEFRRPEFLKKDGLGDQEACGFKAEDGDQLVLQGTYLRLAKGLTAQLRSHGTERDKLEKEISFDELFGEREVVIGTTCEALHILVPVCKSKMELAEYILGLREYKGDYTRDAYIAEAERLAKFLYKHNPNKERDVLDELAEL